MSTITVGFFSNHPTRKKVPPWRLVSLGQAVHDRVSLSCIIHSMISFNLCPLSNASCMKLAFASLGCIYRHDRAAIQSNPQSDEPCMAYLAGHCAFNAKSCHKRHPPPAEAERLRQKYSQIRCRYGSECQTEGCLYRHEALSEPVSLVDWVAHPMEPTPRPPLAAALPGTSWRPTPPSNPPLPSQHR